jgi:DNA gyrase/topoisomerase IV subunit B
MEKKSNTTKSEKQSDAKHNSKSRNAKQISMLEHARKKSMWAGSKSNQTIDCYVLTTKEGEKVFEVEELKYPPALLKIIDEVIVNAIDHHTHYHDEVTDIKITVNNGEISVYNNGPGIPIEETSNINGVKMYLPQLIASEFLAGDNLDDDGGNIKGGTNGIGLKLASAFSEYLTLETVDKNTKYFQKIQYVPGKKELVVSEPTLTETKLKSYTKITFLPRYKEDFGLDVKEFNPILHKLLETRTWQAAAYTDAKVSFNGEKIPIKSFEEYCQMHTENLVYMTEMTGDKYDWEVGFAISDGKERQLSIVNGVYIPKGGNHIKHIQNTIVENLKAKVERGIKKSGVKFNKNLILNNVFVFMKGAIPSPEFLSQTKEAISDPVEKFKKYQIAEKHWKKIWDLLGDYIMSSFLKKQIGDLKTRTNRNKVDVPKYKEAKNCRDPKNCLKCGLIITEGDSASGTADTGLLAKASENFNYDWFGVYGIQGVMMNALKESVEDIKKTRKKKVKDTKVSDVKGLDATKVPAALDVKASDLKPSKTKPRNYQYNLKDELSVQLGKRLPNKKLLENERVSSLIKVLGLDFTKSYELNEIGEKEFKTLRYGFIVGLMDQDLDGFNIFGLLCTFIMTYWPALVKRGFIRRINTPVMRAYPSNKKDLVYEFYTEKEFQDWVHANKDKTKNYEVKYYKGLGSHTQAFKEVTQMFKNINTKICKYEFDEYALKSMYIYYGDDSMNRKRALSSAVSADVKDGLMLPISQHFEVDTKSYQRDNIIRKLLNLVDGFVTSRRKVFFTARKHGHSQIKVQGLSGKVVALADYHHGEASLEQTIVKMAQGYPGAKNLPLLQPLGQFGTRAKGYKDYAASRYIFTTINYRLADKLFRREDDYILPYEVIDGNRYEPIYYCPVIPYVLCENNDLPATGWAITMHARDIGDIFSNLRKLINGKIQKCGKLSYWKKDFKGDIREYKNKKYFVGCYKYNESENTVHITELPPGIFSNHYLRGPDTKKDEVKKGIQGKEWVEDFDDNTTMEGVDIILYLKPGAYDAICESKYGNETFDPFEEYFDLKEVMYDNINLVNEKGEVVEYESYEKVFDDWFVYRKELYSTRVKREIILVDLEIKLLNNIQRFSKLHDKYNITHNTTEEQANKILSENKYVMYNHAVLENPRFTSVEELIKLITIDDVSYEYLLRLNYRDLTKDAYEKREKKINELEDRLKYLLDDKGMFKGAKIWLKELEELEDAIDKGLKSEWFYGENKFKFAS